MWEQAHPRFWPALHGSGTLRLRCTMPSLFEVSVGVSDLSKRCSDLEYSQKSSIKFHKKTLDRNGPSYRKKHYRAHWQPVWAILGLVLSTLLMVFSGWAAIYDLVAKSPGVNRADSIVDLIAAYLGVSPESLKNVRAGADSEQYSRLSSSRF